MITSIFISISFIFCSPYIEEERVGVEFSLCNAFIKGFKPSIGSSVGIIFITDGNLGASIGFSLLRNKGESIYRESLGGMELTSALSSRYITFTTFELNYTFAQKRFTPFAGAGVNWIYFHEQSKFVYHAPGWIITSWKNNQGTGFCFSAVLGIRYIFKPSFAIENKLELIKGKFYYPAIKDNVKIDGLSISIGIRI
ncbi:hypothetical protein KAU34_09285 [candidate division WOR-3 bacterium]|nr:hypothetical protein [candidate division WOR-3 bacterium]